MTAPVFTGCTKCLDTGWAYVPHSDESREACDCASAELKRQGIEYGAIFGTFPMADQTAHLERCADNTNEIALLDSLRRAMDELFVMRAMVIMLSVAVLVLSLRRFFP